MNKLPRANKTLGQHFLRDEKIISSICSDFANECDVIIEVGPGPGILTQGLSQIGKPLYVVEKDERFPELLVDWVDQEKIYLTDALEFDWQKFFEDNDLLDKKIWLVSNLPYNVSAPLTLKFIQMENIKWMTLMYQREVADKICPIDTRKGKQMNSLFTLGQSYFDVGLFLKVPPGAFNPPPKVDSAVLSFTRIEEPKVPLAEFKKLEKFARILFQMKRKQVFKVLKSAYPAEKLEEAFQEVGIERTARAESFNLEKVQLLYSYLNK